MTSTAPTQRFIKTHHVIDPGRNPGLPPELILLVLRQLEGKYGILLQLSLSCKLLHAEVQPILYRSLHVRLNYGIPLMVITGPPPKSYLKNPSLASYIWSITYLECVGVSSHKRMHKILSGSFTHYMPNLKTLTLALEHGIPKGFIAGGFQLEELSMSGEDFPDDLAATPRNQSQLKSLRIFSYQPTLPALPLSVCPELPTLEADMSVIGSFLALHNIRTLVWEPSYRDNQMLDGVDHLAKGLRGLKALCYTLTINLPPLHSLVKHLGNLQYFALEHHAAGTNSRLRQEYSILTDLPHDLSVISHLRGLALSSSYFYQSPGITSNSMQAFFKACPCLEFVDVEISGHSHPRRFTRWFRGHNGEPCYQQQTLLQYRRLKDCFPDPSSPSPFTTTIPPVGILANGLD